MTHYIPDTADRILVDVDGTICDNLPRACEFVEVEYGIDLSPADVTEWSYQVDGAGIPLADVFDQLLTDRPEWYLSDLEPIDGARRALRTLSSEGYEVWIVTHRPSETHDLTRRWLSDVGITYDQFVEDVPSNKAAVPGDVLVDDFHGHVQDAALAGIVGVLLDRPYNTVPAHNLAVLADGWEDVTDLLLESAEA